MSEVGHCINNLLKMKRYCRSKQNCTISYQASPSVFLHCWFPGARSFLTVISVGVSADVDDAESRGALAKSDGEHMSEHPYFVETNTFEPDALDAMARALDEACAALKVSDSRSRNAIAVRILALARAGIIEADKLRERVLQEPHPNYY